MTSSVRRRSNSPTRRLGLSGPGRVGSRAVGRGRRLGRCELSAGGQGSLFPVAPTAELFDESGVVRTPTELGSSLGDMGALIE